MDLKSAAAGAVGGAGQVQAPKVAYEQAAADKSDVVSQAPGLVLSKELDDKNILTQNKIKRNPLHNYI